MFVVVDTVIIKSGANGGFLLVHNVLAQLNILEYLYSVFHKHKPVVRSAFWPNHDAITDFRLLQWLIIDINSVPSLLNRVDVSDVADVLVVPATSIFLVCV
jgi:hypothetical protein